MLESELDIRLGAPVITADGRRTGVVDRVVVDPASRKVTALVVHAGALLTRDVTVPIECVESASPRELYLRLRADELGKLPDFVESAFVPLDSQDVPPLITWEGPPTYEPRAVLVPASSLYMPGVKPYAPQIVEERKGTPPGGAEVAEGTPVECVDGVLGVVDEVRADSVDGRVVAVMVREGNRRWLIPVDRFQVREEAGSARLMLRRCQVEPYAYDGA